MDEFWHDSPTFLNRSNSFVLGLTLTQMLLVAGIGLIWGICGMILESAGLSTGLAWIIAGTGLGVSVAMALVRVSGLRLSHYLMLSLLRWRNRPSYWIQGNSMEWDGEPGGESGMLSGIGRLSEEQVVEARVAGRGIERAARESYRSIRDYLKYTMRMMVKGKA